MSAAGALAVVLHQGPVRVARGRSPNDPLLSFVLESCLPIMEVVRRLALDAVPFQMTLCVDPRLAAALEDPGTCARLAAALPAHDEARAALYADLPEGGLLAELRRWQAAGWVELAPVTPGSLAALAVDREALFAHVATTVSEHERLFGGRPNGLWPAGLGFLPGCEAPLEALSLRWVAVAPEALLGASSAPVFGTFAPLACPGTRVAAFAPDDAEGRALTADDGRPPGGAWRSVRPAFRQAPAFALYDAAAAKDAASHLASEVVTRLEVQARTLRGRMDRPPLTTLAFEWSHLGAGWVEGPAFLEALFRHLHARPRALTATTPARWLEQHPVLQQACPGAWWPDAGGPDEDWPRPHLLHAAERLRATTRRAAGEAAQRFLKQAARELVLAQSVDWGLARAHGDVDETVARFRDHLATLHRLCDDLESPGDPDGVFLAARETRFGLFPTIDPAAFAR